MNDTQMQELADRAEIADLVSRLGLWLDEQRFDGARSILTEDITVETPGGSARGLERVAEQARRNHEVPTQHFIANVLVDLDGDRATVGANLMVRFVPSPTLGERYRFEAVRTPDGWRLSSIQVRPVWKDG